MAQSKSHGSHASHEEDAKSHTTTDHEVIRKWVEARGGKPSCVQGTGGKGDTGLLRIDYSGEGKLHEISWDEFFEKFDEQKLAFLYQEHTKDGSESRFSKIVSRETAKANESHEKSHSGSHAGGSHSSASHKSESHSGSHSTSSHSHGKSSK